jgi:hypothetical protein
MMRRRAWPKGFIVPLELLMNLLLTPLETIPDLPMVYPLAALRDSYVGESSCQLGQRPGNAYGAV